MMKESLVQFLDTGWYTEATLYCNGYIYWCEGNTDFDTGITKFFVARWKAKNENDELYHTYCGKDLEPLDYSVVFKEKGMDMDLIKKHFLEAKIFDGKSFWEVENDLLWLENSGEDIVVGNGEVL